MWSGVQYVWNLLPNLSGGGNNDCNNGTPDAKQSVVLSDPKSTPAISAISATPVSTSKVDKINVAATTIQPANGIILKRNPNLTAMQNNMETFITCLKDYCDISVIHSIQDNTLTFTCQQTEKSTISIKIVVIHSGKSSSSVLLGVVENDEVVGPISNLPGWFSKCFWWLEKYSNLEFLNQVKVEINQSNGFSVKVGKHLWLIEWVSPEYKLQVHYNELLLDPVLDEEKEEIDDIVSTPTEAPAVPASTAAIVPIVPIIPNSMEGDMEPVVVNRGTTGQEPKTDTKIDAKVESTADKSAIVKSIDVTSKNENVPTLPIKETIEKIQVLPAIATALHTPAPALVPAPKQKPLFKAPTAATSTTTTSTTARRPAIHVRPVNRLYMASAWPH